MTAYDGQSITYDGVGNPLTYGNTTYTWEHGRELASMTKGAQTWTYTYDANGMRTKRTNGTKTYSYVYNSGQLSQMTVGSDTLVFTYDAAGRPLAVSLNGTVYYYATNPQGDVTGIWNETDGYICEYFYDAWGYITTTRSYVTSDITTLNPLRYRGYVYDTETGLYYLQSRYYNPKWGRFLNADAFVATGQGMLGSNMFAYCRNNPVCRIDISGTLDVEIFDDDANLLDDDKIISGGTAGAGSSGGSGGSGHSHNSNYFSGSGKTASTGQNIQSGQSTSSQSSSNGWKVGQDITKPTRAGNKPSWSALRQRFWKNEAYYRSNQYSEANQDLMRNGRAPRDSFGRPYELHHPFGREGDNFYRFTPVTHEVHQAIHYGG